MLQWQSWVLVIFAFSSSLAQLQNLNIVREWKYLDFVWPSADKRELAINSGGYDPNNCVPIDVAVHYNGNNERIFVTIPRFNTGIPITLATVSEEQGPGGPLLNPYPDWNTNENQSCNGIISVFRVAIDECDRLWVLDTGRIADKQLCPPQLLVFNLTNNELIRTYQIPSDLYKSDSLFITLVVDVRNTEGFCADTMVYIADVTGFGILVYNNELDIAWRFENKLTYPNPDYGTFTIAGESFDLMDGIFGLALTPKGSQNRQLFFHALASSSENRVPLSVLDRPKDVNTTDPSGFVEIGKRGKQSTAEAMDRNGNLFFGLISPIAVGCWDSSQEEYNANRIRVVVQNDETLQFSSGMKVAMNRESEELWVLSCRFQRVMNGTLSLSEVNFRIQSSPIDEILGGSTNCLSAGASLDTYE